MGYDFNAGEIFDLACRMEENGAGFYEEMSGKFKDVQVQRMLQGLAAMEKSHRKVFEKMKTDLTAAETAPIVFDPEGETARYLKAMADIHVFDKKAAVRFQLHEDMTESAKLSKVLRSAIDMEWASISFYTGIREFVPQNLGKDKIDDIIKEEMRHVSLLSKRLVSPGQ